MKYIENLYLSPILFLKTMFIMIIYTVYQTYTELNLQVGYSVLTCCMNNLIKQASKGLSYNQSDLVCGQLENICSFINVYDVPPSLFFNNQNLSSDACHSNCLSDWLFMPGLPRLFIRFLDCLHGRVSTLLIGYSFLDK